MSWLDTYRNIRQDFRESTPSWLRTTLKTVTPLAGLYGAEQTAGAFIPGEGQTGLDYVPSMFAADTPQTNSTPDWMTDNRGGGSSPATNLYPSPAENNSSGSNLNAYLAAINAQRGLLQNQYTTGYQDINTSAGRQALSAQTQASRNVSDINTNLSDIETQGAKGMQTVRSSADVAKGQVSRDTRGNFGARGALDSTYYTRALQAGLGDIGVQEQEQIKTITESLDKARSDAMKQKDRINADMQQVLGDLEDKRQASLKDLEQQYQQGMISLDQLQAEAGADPTKWAQPSELNKINALVNSNFAIDSYLNDIDTRATETINSINEQKKNTQGFSIDLANVNTLLNSLGKGLNAGYKKSDFVPLLVGRGMSLEEANSILNRAELYSRQMATAA